MRGNRHISRLLLLVIIAGLTITSHAQRPDERSFDHLWTLYDGIREYYVRDQRSMLDTIGWKAETEHNAYHLFIVN